MSSSGSNSCNGSGSRIRIRSTLLHEPDLVASAISNVDGEGTAGNLVGALEQLAAASLHLGHRRVDIGNVDRRPKRDPAWLCQDTQKQCEKRQG